MRLPRRGERGFTLIELLIVVAILGVLAAVVIPNVTQFLGAGKEEAKDTEFANIQAAVSAMMVDNGIALIPAPAFTRGNTATNEMSKFPDTLSSNVYPTEAEPGKVTDPTGDAYDFAAGTDPDEKGYMLYGHDIDASPSTEADNGARVNYVAQPTTAYFYTVDASGTVTQWASEDASPAGGTQLNPPLPPSE